MGFAPCQADEGFLRRQGVPTREANCAAGLDVRNSESELREILQSDCESAMKFSATLAALALAAAHEEGGSSMSAPAASGPELAIEFALADDEVVLHKVSGAEAVFTCVKLTLHPEEGEQQWARAAKVQFPTELPAAAKLLPRKKAWRPKSVAKKAEGCAAAGGVYVRLDRLHRFVNGAVNATDVEGSECAAASAEAASAKPDSPLRKAIGAWNDRFFNMETAETRQNAELFHGRGSEPKHLAQEVRRAQIRPRNSARNSAAQFCADL